MNRELLEEARDRLDKRIITCQNIEPCRFCVDDKDLITRIDTALSEPEPEITDDLMELIFDIRTANIQEPYEGCQQIGYFLTDEEAARRILAFKAKAEPYPDAMEMVNGIRGISTVRQE